MLQARHTRSPKLSGTDTLSCPLVQVSFTISPIVSSQQFVANSILPPLSSTLDYSACRTNTKLGLTGADRCCLGGVCRAFRCAVIATDTWDSLA